MSDDKSKLSHEDRIIWARVARTVEAFPGKEVEVEDWFAVEIPPEPAAAPENKAKHPPSILSVNPPTKPRAHPIEKPVIRKLARGRLPIDGRIDLHGLTQSEAHNLLFGFLAGAHERGLRHVLVITGKGSSRGSEGVLKRIVPDWLGKPEFRFLISGYEDAARSHGGEGALYIRLRRERGNPK
ncbi:MAG: Smr/MutS family protein [Hoeflea sp.]|uniref:Smr/MutS family protein n=1 Tax=Hoeflea sp. TaxID=1940281 RepID=UPI001DC44D90|nr:Smr/MutS family protein [Hoeflea sp.]MBU4531772.1 Smr/MutS family protein [Alphaproteobacteria bacterium]MBU4544628.1 Smr/MutS family protein [Alphaproteobacteria bacterium]MBU4552859.1 Smr/MutS family protein [Alphaproteobacteria bacterium]MBV1725048.1 Smr/MutS family protein [Hoeflea sp.]MBV1761068.1 Smr/MutS family protein [Hoeflea sp.]